jgi:quercetin dioxygenase-like cupin family protein
MTFFRVADLPKTEMLKGIDRRAVYLDNAMLTFFDFEPDSIVPEHQHPHEQITLVLSGAMEFTLGDETQVIEAGEGVTIPSNVPHGARILAQPTKAIDAWHPIREDYK